MSVSVCSCVCAELLGSRLASTSCQWVDGGGVAAQGGGGRLVEDAQLAEVFEAIQEGLLLLLRVGGQRLLGQAHAPAHTAAPPALPVRQRGGLRRGWGGR